jgi:hypothetical protein
MKYKIYLLLFVLASVTVGCGESGRTATSSPTSTAYQAGLTIGDNGNLCINTNLTTAVVATSSCPALNALSYSLSVTNSSFSLTGKTFSGTLVANSDGSFSTSDGNEIFSRPNYQLIAIKITPTTAPNYFSLNSDLSGSSFIYIPVVALKSSNLLTTVDQITSGGAAMEYRTVNMTFHAPTGSNTINQNSYLAQGGIGNITKLTDTSFSVAVCSNGGTSANNSNMTNCSASNAITKTFTYNASVGSWQLQWDLASSYPSQVANAYFVQDVMTNSVFGYIDVSDSTMASSAFAFVQIVPHSLQTPTFSGSNPSINTTSYEACTTSANCGTNGAGIESYSSLLLSSVFNSQTTWQSDGPCSITSSLNSPSNGFMAQLITNNVPGDGLCNQPGDGGDNIFIFFGTTTTSSGKVNTLTASVGYDHTLDQLNQPSQKLGVNSWLQN